MTRPLRIEFLNAYYHVTARGNERKKIFRSDEDREQFFIYIETSSERFGAVFHCYCLMDNHYHFFLQTPLGNLSQIMHYVNTSYTVYFNRRYKRVGHLFQGRYKAILVEPDSYAMELSRYIHLNPVHAKVVKRADDYLWSSYRHYLNQQEKPLWLKVDFILNYFGKEKPERIQYYQTFVEELIGKKYENPLKEVVSSILLGSEKFINKIKEKYVNDKEINRDQPSVRTLKRMCTVEEISEAVEKEAIDINQKLKRKMAIYLCHRYSGYPLKNIGVYFGISESAVSQISVRFEKEFDGDENMRVMIDNIRKDILDFKMSNV